MPPLPALLLHATTVAIGDDAVLLRGRPGAGKSDLALRLIVHGGARLVADDQTRLERRGDAIAAAAPATIAGKLEVRGIGILEVPSRAEATLRLVADLVAPDSVERLPEPRFCELLGLPVPVVAVAPFEASAEAKLRLALAALAKSGAFR
jgi:HPr kinase/phosphorylase